MCELEIYAAKNMRTNGRNMFPYLSPQLSETLVWFLKESVHGYLFMAESSYDELSPLLHMMLANDTPIGVQVVNFFVRKVLINFHIWSAENTITSQSAKLLLGKLYQISFQQQQNSLIHCFKNKIL